MKTIEKGGELHDDKSAIAWFYRLQRNEVIDYYRRTGVRKRALRGQSGHAAADRLSKLVRRFLDRRGHL